MTFEGGAGASAGAGGSVSEAMVSPSGRSVNGSHKLAAYAVCPRLGYLRYERLLTLTGDKPYRLRGTLVHLALAYHYASLMDPPPAWFMQRDMRAALEEKGRGLPAGVQAALEILVAYQHEYANEHPETWPLAVEEQFVATLGEIDPLPPPAIVPHDQREYYDRLRQLDGEIVSCRPDLLLARGAEIWEVDYKTTGKSWGKSDGLERWSDYNEYALNWQVLLNLHILRAPSNRERLGGRSIRGFLIRRMTREPDRHGKYYLDEHVLQIPRLAYERAPRSARMAVAAQQELRALVRIGVPPQANYWACFGRYGPCDYRPICAANTTEEQNQRMADDYVVEA